jgi:glutamate racemase
VGSAASVATLVLLCVKEKQKAKCILFGCCHYLHLFTCIAERVGTVGDGLRLITADETRLRMQEQTVRNETVRN